jgi:hypothetical protein
MPPRGTRRPDGPPVCQGWAPTISVNVRDAVGNDATNAEQASLARYDPEIVDHPGTIGQPWP